MLPFLETMATQVCNLSCEGCTNYSDLPHSGYVPWSVMHNDLSEWLKILDIPDFGIMGGEPLINPEIRQWIQGIRDLLPTSQIRFTTNGILLNKHIDIVDRLHEIGNVVFKITVHREDAQVEETIQRIFDRYSWEPITEYGINRWTTGDRVRFQVNRPTTFIKTYQGSYKEMMPYVSTADASFAECIQQTCPLLHKGRIYKCSTQGLLRETLTKVGNPNMSSWQPYLLDGVGIDSTIADITRFVNNFGKPHSMCAMCPSKQHPMAFISHRAKLKNESN